MKLKLILACFIAGVVAVSFAHPPSNDEQIKWDHFKRNFGKSYSNDEEELQRRTIFLNNINSIQDHNKLFEEGKVSFDLKINKFADLTTKEFKERMNGFKKPKTSSQKQIYSASDDDELPSSVDWRTKGAVTPVKNQGQCGSCWAFSTTGALEGQHFLKTGKLVSLSEQNLVDCSTAEGNDGCGGGFMDQGFEYVKENGGIDTENSYPYTASDGTCKFDKANVGATLKNFTDVESGSESSLQSALAKIGPVSVAIDAGEMSFQFYNSGIYYETRCSPEELDHGVLAVGYGSNNKGDYWIVKNSWGEDWGQEGYILMARNKENNCGIATQASYPTV